MGVISCKNAKSNGCAAAVNSVVGRKTIRAFGISERRGVGPTPSLHPLSAQARFALAAEAGFLVPLPVGPSE